MACPSVRASVRAAIERKESVLAGGEGRERCKSTGGGRSRGDSSSWSPAAANVVPSVSPSEALGSAGERLRVLDSTDETERGGDALLELTPEKAGLPPAPLLPERRGSTGAAGLKDASFLRRAEVEPPFSLDQPDSTAEQKSTTGGEEFTGCRTSTGEARRAEGGVSSVTSQLEYSVEEWNEFR